MLKQVYNPDVLTCIANLSSDEVFTPPSVVNQMLDTLPIKLWSDEKVTFLDPVSKSGVFLREITKRLIDGLESKIPNLEERIEHILRNQVFGIGITELTSLISRRSLYCSKYANGKYSIVQFDDEQGNLKYFETEHTWEGGSCKYCGVSKEIYDRGEELESYSYSFIHSQNPEKLFNMKFDVIVGNPPYQMNDGGGKGTGSSVPIYQEFISKSIKLNPRYLSMIVPSRWFSGGRGLDEFREKMLNDRRISKLYDYTNSTDVFPGVDIAGGVCYFLWEKDFIGDCSITSVHNGVKDTSERPLNEFEIFVRNNLSVKIIKKVKKQSSEFLSDFILSSKPFGFRSFEKGKKTQFKDCIVMVGSSGNTYVSREEVKSNSHLINKYKVMFSKASTDHGGQPDKEGKRKIFSRVEVLPVNHICTESYLVVGNYDSYEESENLVKYLKTKFCRFLVSTILLTQNISKSKFEFVPKLNMNETWSDEKLYKKYGLNEEEIEFIETMIRPME